MSSVRPLRLPVSNERGIVLAAALLFVVLASVLVLTMMLTTVGERSQSSNVQTAKLSLYAADAGVRTQQQLLANFAKGKLDSCYTAWVAAGKDPSQPIVTAPALVFPAGTLVGPLAASSANPTFTASAGVTFSGAEVGPQSQA